MKKILILDDEARVLRVLVDYLRAPDLEIVTCSEIEAAECLLDRYAFDVLVTDLELSNLGGLEGLRLIRHATVHYPQIQVVVFSGKLNDEVRELGIALGVTELLVKPTELNRLRELINGRRANEGPAARSNGGAVSHVDRIECVLEDRTISALLQPIVGLASSDSSSSGFGFEGLARGPEGSILRSPEFLLAYASKKEKLFEAELQCIEAVLSQASQVPRVGKLFINVRPRSLSNADFAKLLSELVRRHGFERSEIVLELTEQQSILNLEAFEATLGTLRDHGFGLALDDFGNGFANLHLLQQLPLDYLKVDGFFCRSIEKDTRKQQIVHSTFEMARELGIATIMERVETEEELEVVRDLGASYAQGYYFSPPVPGRDLVDSFQPREATYEEADDGSDAPAPPAFVREPGGFVKHEVSNLLTAIALYAAQSMKTVDQDHPLYDDLLQIRLASERAIELSDY